MDLTSGLDALCTSEASLFHLWTPLERKYLKSAHLKSAYGQIYTVQCMENTVQTQCGHYSEYVKVVHAV